MGDVAIRQGVLAAIAATVLASCTGLQPPLGERDQAGQQNVKTSTYRIVHRFNPRSDGVYPMSALVDVDGALCGTTSKGGFHYGTVFCITGSGALKVLHRFKNDGQDGQRPQAGLIESNGILYGTTTWGGSFDDGTVYSITAGGKEKVLHSFGGGSDGAFPNAGLISVNGTLYGTTTNGGAGCPSYDSDGCGVVYSITKTGTEKILHAFAAGTDGADPFAGLLDVDGILFGTTYQGGLECGSGNSCGTIYTITTAGAENVLYRFAGPDGAFPAAGLTRVKGLLFGTTLRGGAQNGGTVYQISSAGVERVLHGFDGGTSAALPSAALISVKDTLYGTTQGSPGCGSDTGRANCGTVFRIESSGAISVVHRFDGTDGASPQAALMDLNGILYGTTTHGGSGCQGPSGSGCGVIFALSP